MIAATPLCPNYVYPEYGRLQYVREFILCRLYPLSGSYAGYHSWYINSCYLYQVISINRSFLWIRLATDLAHHLSIFPKLSNLVTTGFDTTRADHHKLLLFLIMTSADLSDQTKNWKSSRNAAVRHAIQFNYTTLYQLVIQFQFSINCS